MKASPVLKLKPRVFKINQTGFFFYAVAPDELFHLQWFLKKRSKGLQKLTQKFHAKTSLPPLLLFVFHLPLVTLKMDLIV